MNKNIVSYAYKTLALVYEVLKKKLTKPRLTLLTVLLISLISNIFIANNIQFYFFRQILSSLYLLLIPGLLTSWVLKIKYKNIWELISYTTGLSLIALMLIGLGVNYLLPYIYPILDFQTYYIPVSQMPKPLTLQPILLSLNLALSILWLYVFIKNSPIPFSGEKLGRSFKSIILGIVATFFPIFSIIGAISLNNNQSNIFTMVMLGSIATFVILLTIMRDKISQHVFPYSLFMIAMSLLFMTSLRGWYITGHDINLEYFVFQLTKMQGVWKMINFQDPYNACLSITILPTIFSAVTHISDFYIYKVLYQIIFATSIITTYLFIRKLLNPFLAFLGTFIIMSLPTFMTDMPMLNRQEIALLFFALLLNSVFQRNFSKKKKWLLFLLFGMGLAVSHYSTTYIGLVLFLGTSAIYLTLSLIHRIHPNIKKVISTIDSKLGIQHDAANIHLGMIILLFGVTIVWNFNITHTSKGITQTITNIQRDLNLKHFGNGKNDPSSYGLIKTKKPTNQQVLINYVDTLTKYVRQFNTDDAFFDKNIYNQYPTGGSSQIKQPLSYFGQILASHHISPFAINNFLKDAYAKIVQIFIVIGLILIFLYRKYIQEVKKEYVVLFFVFFGLIVAQTVLPGNSINYGILRLLQQGLILLVVPLLIGALSIFSILDKIHKSIKIYLTSFIFILFFLYLSGFIPTLTGGYFGQLNLANSGFYYQAYYTHDAEITSINWLISHKGAKTPIQSDWFTLNKIHTYTGLYSVDGLIPSTIRINSYVYLSYSNVTTGQIMVYVNGSPIYYKFPMQFLDDNKNLVYSNGLTKIYR